MKSFSSHEYQSYLAPWSYTVVA